jgi:hypothetical protein
MEDLQNQIRSTLSHEMQILEELEAFYQYQESIAREIMCRAQAKLVEIENEKLHIARNANDSDLIKKPSNSYKQPFLFVGDD